jgi:hypothetical protein
MFQQIRALEVRFLLISHEISLLPKHYDLIPNLGTNFTGSNKLGTKIPDQMLPFVSAIEQSMRPEFYHIQQEKDIPLSVLSHAPFLHPSIQSTDSFAGTSST